MGSLKFSELGIPNLAFVGDAVYELMMRARIAGDNPECSEQLHNETVLKVCAKFQAIVYDLIKDKLDEQEHNILRRGRNYKSSRYPANTKPIEYRKATGVEAVFGFWFLSGEDARLKEIFDVIFKELCQKESLPSGKQD